MSEMAPRKSVDRRRRSKGPHCSNGTAKIGLAKLLHAKRPREKVDDKSARKMIHDKLANLGNVTPIVTSKTAWNH